MYMKKRGKKKQSATGDTKDNSDDSNRPTSPPISPPPPVPSAFLDPSEARLGSYQLMESIGRGGYGVVYRGLSIESGHTVAIKRIALGGVSIDEVSAIEAEISLLQNLSHPNIVRYIDSYRTPQHLNIMLEYVENGSLSSLLARFGGQLPETLVAHYIAQVCKGLDYLHRQGVIHRDIKGANILSTKEGTIKLADFGVATRLNETRKSDSVVGTPYWMAPEVIEMTGQQSSACDIWSVGCTTIELLTGKPPYYDLQQMPALFRIVQDDHPPLPDGCSPALTDFLLECFAKDPNMRITAVGLLKHPWLKKALEQTDDGEVAEAVAVAAAVAAQNVKVNGVVDRIEEKREPYDEDDEDWDNESDAKVPAAAKGLHLLTPKQAVSGSPHTGVSNSDDPFADFSDDDENETAAAPAQKNNTLSASIGTTENSSGSFIGVATVPPAAAATTATASATDMMVAPSVGVVGGKRWTESIDSETAEYEAMLGNAAAVDKIVIRTDDESAVSDPFDDIQFDDGVSNAVDEDSVLSKTFSRLVTQLTLGNDERAVLESCEKILEFIKTKPDLTLTLMTHYAVIPIMEMLESRSPSILHMILRVINTTCRVTSHRLHTFQNSLSLTGLIPHIIRLSQPSYSPLIRLEAATFIRQFCYASDDTRSMFIACDGLPVLVGFLRESYIASKMLVFNAIDCIRHVFDIHNQPKNDFCRLFCKYQLLLPLSHVAISVATDKSNANANEYLKKIIQIIHLFSQGDKVVKLNMAQPAVVSNILLLLRTLKDQNDITLLLLKTISNLSMDSDTLDFLESANVIPTLVPFLSSSSATDHQHQVLLALFYLCLLSPSRQEQAVVSGIVPHLQRVIRTDHPMKQIAYPILFHSASNAIKLSERMRVELCKHGGVRFYVEFLRDTYWRGHALDVIAMWMDFDPARVGFALQQTSPFNALLHAFVTTTNPKQFETMLNAYRKLVSSPANLRLNQCFGRSYLFLHEIRRRLESRNDLNAIRVNLLNILGFILVAHDRPNEVDAQHGLSQLLSRLKDDRDSVLVASLSATLLQKLQDGTNHKQET